MGTDETPARLVRIPAAAWRLAEESAPAAGDDGPVPAPAPGPAREDLTEAGVVAGDFFTPAWTRALAVVGSPQVVLRITAVHQGISARSTVNVAGPRVVSVTRRRAVEPTAEGGLRITGHEPTVEVALFSLDTFWGGIRRVLPPLPQLRAGAAEASSVLRAGDGVDEEEALEVAARHTAQVTVELASAVDGGQRAWVGMWAVREEQLYSIRTRQEGDTTRPVVVPVQAGHIAREVGFALVGALSTSATRGGAA